MVHVVTGLFAIQAVAGLALLVRWARRGRRAAPVVVSHVALGASALALWVAFAGTAVVWWAWAGFVVITAGNAIGDDLLRRRGRAIAGSRGGFWRDYRQAIALVFQGRMPALVVFHALFAGVVYFTCLGVCIGASIGASIAA